MVVLYGINAATEICFESYTDKLNVAFVTTQGGETFRGNVSTSLEEFSKADFSVIDKVIICSSFVGEITKSLLDVGFPLSRVYCFDTYHVELSPISSIVRPRIDKSEILYAFYDLANNWITFDCIAYCILADLERRRLGKKYIHFVIVPDVSSEVDFVGAFQCHSESDKAWRLDHIVKSVFTCVPAVVGVSSLAYREEADFYTHRGASCFPQGYKSNAPVKNLAHAELLRPKRDGLDMSIFQAPPTAISLVSSFLDKYANGRKVVAINLRESDIQSSRNSLLSEWAKFCQSLDESRYLPVIVRDFYASLDPLPKEFNNALVMPQASADFAIRAALYQKAYVNMSITNGPFYMLNFIKGARSITFVELDDDNPCMSESTWNGAGYTVGEDVVLRDNDAQQIFWGRDTFENIQQAFARLETVA